MNRTQWITCRGKGLQGRRSFLPRYQVEAVHVGSGGVHGQKGWSKWPQTEVSHQCGSLNYRLEAHMMIAVICT